MKSYRKKPVVVQAVQWTGGNVAEVSAFAGTDVGYHHSTTGRLTIRTIEGSIWADKGDYIIRGVQGEHYPCKPDIFRATYEEVD